MRHALTLATACLIAAIPLAALSPADAAGRLKSAANFETGTPGQADHEDFSFYLMQDGSKEVHYTYGADWKEVKLRYLGPKPGAEPAFRVQFPNRLVLEVSVQGESLQVRSADGRYDKTFRWQYEGPVDGRGTFCEPCVEEKEAPGLVTQHFAR